MDVVKRICDCVAVISNGQLIEQDTVSEVFPSEDAAGPAVYSVHAAPGYSG
jgi:ABC-type methionine transport system ATPase subunit